MDSNPLIWLLLVLKKAVAIQINELDSDMVPVPKELLHQKLKENLPLLPSKFYEDVYKYARLLICKTIFLHTNALEILTAIDNVGKDFPY